MTFAKQLRLETDGQCAAFLSGITVYLFTLRVTRIRDSQDGFHISVTIDIWSIKRRQCTVCMVSCPMPTKSDAVCRLKSHAICATACLLACLSEPSSSIDRFAARRVE